jgi:putative GTP pyrophosphokinase
MVAPISTRKIEETLEVAGISDCSRFSNARSGFNSNEMPLVEELYLKAIEFYQTYGDQLDQIRQLLDIRLNQLALAYTNENKLPRESIFIRTRVKSFTSFLKKLDVLGMSDFEYPDKIVHDLIGARIVCWFLDDCKGITNCISNSNFIVVKEGNKFDYIENPKPSGYRGIHLHATISFENISTANCQVKHIPQRITCEIQIRTKLMDAWADLTHEFHYKALSLGVKNDHLEKVLESQSKRFFSEDESFVAIRDIYQSMTGKQL